MLDLIATLCVFSAILLLIALSVIDLKHWILPDELNFALGLTGVIFHFATAYSFLSIASMAGGGALGAGLLYTIRFVANRAYGRDTLGLGDVKLLGAAGLWLGTDGVMMAVTSGAMAGLLHGLALAFYLKTAKKAPLSLGNLSIPAGPGFAVGILGTGAYMFHAFITETLNALFS